MPKKKQPQQKTISNRRARHDYALDDSFLTGIILTGAETKALRHGHGQLRGAYVTIKNEELWLINATISAMPGIPIEETARTRTRKLLAKRKEIEKLITLKKQGQTIVPLEILTKGRYIKVRIAAGRGKKEYDKRHTLKARDENREARAAIKQRVRS
ncbi:SsrA-binding protein SmpB [Candidatus Saccharibacteria bacterium]|nr:MAG: SsrA-binding protein SmpB [Candidatus Saccharibacteria bacterium]